VVQYAIFGFQFHVIKGGWLFFLPHHASPVCRDPSASNASSLLKSQDMTGNRSRFLFTLLDDSAPVFILSYICSFASHVS
jgi:hypothetical protein